MYILFIPQLGPGYNNALSFVLFKHFLPIFRKRIVSSDKEMINIDIDSIRYISHSSVCTLYLVARAVLSPWRLASFPFLKPYSQLYYLLLLVLQYRFQSIISFLERMYARWCKNRPLSHSTYLTFLYISVWPKSRIL